MKIAVLNYEQECIDIILVSKEEFEEYGGEEFDDVGFLCDKGYSLNEIHWMCVDCGEEPDEIPVYWYNEEIPSIVL